MNFKDMTKPELLEVCEEFGVDADPKMNKAMILTELFENGVTESLYLAAHPEMTSDAEPDAIDEEEYVAAPVTKPAKQKPSNVVLLLMQRENPTFEILGYRFTREHPYALVKEEDVDTIIENNEGFRQATPKEAASYYS